MNLNQYLDIAPEIRSAVAGGKPVVALESTILSHGMPYPENLAFAARVERVIRDEGAVPATMAIIDGRMKAGLTEAELERMCKAEGVAKVSRRDLPILLAQGGTGATTVASTMILASFAGIRIFATGGIGGRTADHGYQRRPAGAGPHPGSGSMRRRQDDSGHWADPGIP